MKIKCLIITLSMSLLPCGFSFGQSADTGDTEISDYPLESIYQASREAHRKLPEKIREKKSKQKLAKIRAEVEYYYKLALTLEKQGKYEGAGKCYEKITELCRDFGVRNHMVKEYNTLIQNAGKSTSELDQKIVNLEKRIDQMEKRDESE